MQPIPSLLEGTIDSVSTPLTGVPTSVTFNPDGTPGTPLNFTVAASDLNTTLRFGRLRCNHSRDVKVTLANPNELLAGLTYSGQNTVTAREQDGYTAGDIASISVDRTGKKTSVHSVERTVELLGTSRDYEIHQCRRRSKKVVNRFSVSPNSGLPAVGTAVENLPSTRRIGFA